MRAVAAALPAVWQAPSGGLKERKEILRQGIEPVAVAVQGERERVQVRITWVGGVQTAGGGTRPRAPCRQVRYSESRRATIAAGSAAGLPLAAIADQRHAARYRPPKRSTRCTGPLVQPWVPRSQGQPHRPGVVPPARLGTAEWWRRDLAHALGMARAPLDHGVRRGAVIAPPERAAPQRGRVKADAAERARWRALHERPAGDGSRRGWPAPPAAGGADAGGSALGDEARTRAACSELDPRAVAPPPVNGGCAHGPVAPGRRRDPAGGGCAGRR
jgi:hypothetical protein